ncbi:hypothetical protein CDO52_12410 [Nocardiopsis gilva YIM 90087]|uniref:Methylamine utilisation protein MauE domain-containing protein n=1 Tax=Nocardiopsis gilva YIM 90087 TaxID=1235441 RepID=A0A223S5T3_9ACTN|nr:MauE/DoxX family redox-associated membrane protein [Nocardiopsis gilva]ASU83481.1 hypothetical protein CDO52_12410 [Nocardiopsis gilva YIM 90087]
MLAPFSEHAMLFCRMVIWTVFTLAAVNKLRDLSSFTDSIRSLLSLPASYARPLAQAVIIVELLIGLMMLVGGAALQWGFSTALFLLLAFSATLVNSLARGRQVSCNCFGSTTDPVSPADVIRNILLSLVPAAGMYVALEWGPATASPVSWDGIVVLASVVVWVTVSLHLRQVSWAFSNAATEDHAPAKEM